MSLKRTFSEAMAEATAEVLGPVGGIQDLKDEIKILKGNLADAEDLIKKLKRRAHHQANEIYQLECLVDVLRRAMPEEESDPSLEQAMACDVICVDEESDAGDAM